MCSGARRGRGSIESPRSVWEETSDNYTLIARAVNRAREILNFKSRIGRCVLVAVRENLEHTLITAHVLITYRFS